MSTDWKHASLALAGVFQAAVLVEQLAKTGYVSSDHQETMIESLFVLNPDSPMAVYGNDPKRLDIGLKAMHSLLQQQNNREHPDALRYVLGMLHLQKKMMQRRDMRDLISKRLEQIGRQAEHFGSTHENVLSSLGGLYGDTISTFKFRIQVMGDFNYLQQARIANQIRALLFSGIRSATLWRQLGGTRLQVIFQRRKLSRCAQHWLDELPPN